MRCFWHPWSDSFGHTRPSLQSSINFTCTAIHFPPSRIPWNTIHPRVDYAEHGFSEDQLGFRARWEEKGVGRKRPLSNDGVEVSVPPRTAAIASTVVRTTLKGSGSQRPAGCLAVRPKDGLFALSMEFLLTQVLPPLSILAVSYHEINKFIHRIYTIVYHITPFLPCKSSFQFPKNDNPPSKLIHWKFSWSRLNGSNRQRGWKPARGRHQYRLPACDNLKLRLNWTLHIPSESKRGSRQFTVIL